LLDAQVEQDLIIAYVDPGGSVVIVGHAAGRSAGQGLYQ